MAFEYLAQYTTFDSVADMDKSVEGPHGNSLLRPNRIRTSYRLQTC